MMEFVIKAGLAGVFFGIWPLVMQRSGMQGSSSSMIFAGVAFLAVAPFDFGRAGRFFLFPTIFPRSLDNGRIYFLT